MASLALNNNAQFAIECRLCGTNAKIKSKCLDCNILICDSCKDNIHPKLEKSAIHRIVGIKDVGKDDKILGSDLDFSGLQCEEHIGNAHCLFCKSCNRLICPRCLTKHDRSHDFSEIREEYETKRRFLLERKFQLNKQTADLVKIENKLQQFMEHEFLKYMEIKQGISDQQSVLRKAVDKFTDDFKKEAEQFWGSIKNSVDKERAQTQKARQNILNKNSCIDNLLDSKDGALVFEGLDQATNSTETTVAALNLNEEKMPRFVAGNLTKDDFGFILTESTQM